MTNGQSSYAEGALVVFCRVDGQILYGRVVKMMPEAFDDPNEDGVLADWYGEPERVGDRDRSTIRFSLVFPPDAAGHLVEEYENRIRKGGQYRKPHTVVSRRGPSRRVPKALRTGEVALRLVLRAPGIDPEDVAAYVRDAVEGWSGSMSGDDPLRKIAVVRILKRAWVDVVPGDDDNDGDDSEDEASQ